MFPAWTRVIPWTGTLLFTTVFILGCTAHDGIIGKDIYDPADNSDSVTTLGKTPDFLICPRIPPCPKLPEIPKCPEIPTCPELKCPDMMCPDIPKFPEIPKCPEPPEWHKTLPRSCKDVASLDPRPVVSLSGGIKVMCDTQTDGGGWTVFQRRINGDVDFYRGWDDYKNGFGDMDGGDFWMGNENLHQLTFWTRHELRVDITFKGMSFSAVYSSFRVFGEGDNYKLDVGGYSGTAGDSLTYHNGMGFSTKDKDNDEHPQGANCAQLALGAWWYKFCHNSNLNGQWGSKTNAQGLNWQTVTGYEDTASFSEMKIRPVT